jgi:cytochrome d ubiquinol oxidase subunit I
MSVAILSRLQFATVALFHFLFVPLTLGLTVLVAWMETMYARTGEETWLKMTRYWSRLMLVNFAVGVVTGITLEFQFGMNWAEYSKFVGDIFGAPLAIEATVAFFLESTFIGLWMFSWKRVSKGVHAALMWVVALASTLSAFWILLANGWMQKPKGFEIVNGHAVLTSFAALLTNPYALIKFLHVVSAAYTLAAFFIMGISAIQMLRGHREEMFRKSLRLGSVFGMVFSLLIIFGGDLSGGQVAINQPSKLAAMEAQWDTAQGADFYLLALPDPALERNIIEALKIPHGTSILAYHDANATVKGLKDIAPADRPPVLVTFLAFRLMVGIGFLLVLLAILAVWHAWRKDALPKARWFLWVLSIGIILPYAAVELGWIVAEIGRQPWIVFGLLRTVDAVSRNLTAGDVLGSLIAFILIYATLAVVDIFLLSKYAKKVDG